MPQARRGLRVNPIVVYKASGGSVSLWPAAGRASSPRSTHFAGNIKHRQRRHGDELGAGQRPGLPLSPSSAITNFR